MALPLVALATVGKWIISFIGEKWTEHQTQKKELQQAEHNYKLTRLQTQAELEAFKQKADLEWDLKWAEGAQKSWKDEYLLILWSIPFIGIFIPGINTYVLEGFERLKYFHPDAPYFYFAGWPVIFAASFGIKAAMEFMLPGKINKALEVMAAADDDVPDKVVDDITTRLKQARERKSTR